MPSPQPQKQVSGRLRRLAFLLIACTVFTVLAHELKYPASAWPSEREVLSGDPSSESRETRAPWSP